MITMTIFIMTILISIVIIDSDDSNDDAGDAALMDGATGTADNAAGR